MKPNEMVVAAMRIAAIIAALTYFAIKIGWPSVFVLPLVLILLGMAGGGQEERLREEQ